MNRRTVLLGLPGLLGCVRTRPPRLNVLCWSDYVAADTIPRFEREFSVQVRFGVFESQEEMAARILSGNSGWDVIFPSNTYVGPLQQMGLLAELDPSRLPLLANLQDSFRRPTWDPTLRHSVPYMWGATGILYRRERGVPTAWADLWSDRYTRRVTMLDDPAEVLGAALKKLGLPLNSTNPDELRRAQAEAIRQKPLVRAYLNAEVRDQVVAGDVLAAQAWAITAQQAIVASPDALGFAFPREGFPLYCDTMAVLAESRRQELAHHFLNYTLRPDVAAEIALERQVATPNRAALALLPAAVRDNPTLYPNPATLARGEWFQPMPPPAQRLRDRLWTEIKAA